MSFCADFYNEYIIEYRLRNRNHNTLAVKRKKPKIATNFKNFRALPREIWDPKSKANFQNYH